MFSFKKKPICCPSCNQRVKRKFLTKKRFCINLDCDKHLVLVDVIDISYESEGVAKTLSNLYPYDFHVSCTQCSSIEGFLRSLTIQDTRVQREVCKLSGINAYRIKKALPDWRGDQTLFWGENSFKRETSEYFDCISAAYTKLFEKNGLFRYFLLSTGDNILIHSRGKSNPKDTILTDNEFIFQLYRLRNLAKSQNIK